MGAAKFESERRCARLGSATADLGSQRKSTGPDSERAAADELQDGLDAAAGRRGHRSARRCDGFGSATAPAGAGGRKPHDDRTTARRHARHGVNPDHRDRAGRSAGVVRALLPAAGGLWQLALSIVSALLLAGASWIWISRIRVRV